MQKNLKKILIHIEKNKNLKKYLIKYLLKKINSDREKGNIFRLEKIKTLKNI
jgi:hypothetical protein